MLSALLIIIFKLIIIAYAQKTTSLFIPGDNATSNTETETLSAVVAGVASGHTTFLVQATSLRGPNDIEPPLTVISGPKDVTVSGDISTVVQSDNSTVTVEAHTTALCAIQGSEATCTETMAVTFDNNTVSTSFVETTSVIPMPIILDSGTTLTGSPTEPAGSASSGQSSTQPVAGSSPTSPGAQPTASQSTTAGGNSGISHGVKLPIVVAVLAFFGLIL